MYKLRISITRYNSAELKLYLLSEVRGYDRCVNYFNNIEIAIVPTVVLTTASNIIPG